VNHHRNNSKHTEIQLWGRIYWKELVFNSY